MKQKLRRPKTEQELELDKIKKGIFTLQIVMACFLAMTLITLNFIVLWYISFIHGALILIGQVIIIFLSHHVLKSIVRR